MTEPSSKTAQQQTGDAGETCVCEHLQQQGWNILARQWRCRGGELDIVAERDRALAFVEVKTRRSSGWDRGGLLAVSAAKQRKIIRAAGLFLAQHPEYGDRFCQFDVALVRMSPADRYEIHDYLAHAFEAS